MKVTVEKVGLEWVVSDEDGEFARATTIPLVLPYVEALLYGPGTARPTGRFGEAEFYVNRTFTPEEMLGAFYRGEGR